MPKTVQTDSEVDEFEGLEVFPKQAPVAKMPVSPGARVKDEKWFAFLQEIPTESWEHLIIYGYRWWPIIDKRIVDPSASTNIFKSEGPVTKDWLLKTWGTGVYNLKLNDTSKRKGQTVTECVVKFEEPYAEYPPVIDYGELALDHKENKGFIEWAIAHGKLEGRGGKVMPSADMGAAQFLIDEGKKRLTEGNRVKPEVVQDPATARITEKAIDYMFQKAVAGDKVPAKSPTEDLTAFANLLKSLGLGTGNSQGDVLSLFMKMQGDMQKLIADNATKQMELMMKLMEVQNKPQPQSNAVDQFKGIAEIMGILHEIGLGGGGKGGGDWKSSLVESVADFLPKGIQATSNLLHNLAVFKGMKAGTPVPPEGMMGEPSLAIPGAPEGAVAANPQQQQVTLQMVGQLGGMVYDAIRRDMNGKQWGMAFIDMHGRLEYDGMCSVGKEQMIEGLKMIPQLWAKFEPIQPTLHKFLDDFMLAGPEFDKGEEDEEDES